MITQLRVELTRFLSRRLLLLLVLAALAAAALVAGKTAWDTRPPSSAELATAQAQAEIDAGDSLVARELSQCLADPQLYLGSGSTRDDCRSALLDTTGYLPRATLDLSGTLRGNGLGLALLVVALMIVAASAFAGSDWVTGSITTQLLYEPRRGRIWLAKLLATGLVAATTAAVSLGGFWMSLDLVAAQRGLPHGGSVATEWGTHLLRAVALAAGAAAGAYAVTMLLRRATAALTLLFVATIGGEALLILLPLDQVARWSPGLNVQAWLATDLEYVQNSATCLHLGDCTGPLHLGHLASGVYLLVLLLVVALASWWRFLRKDV